MIWESIINNKKLKQLLLFIFIFSGCSTFDQKTKKKLVNDFTLLAKNIPVVYRTINKEFVVLEPLGQVKKSLPLPNKLIIEPGLYNFIGDAYNLDEP